MRSRKEIIKFLIKPPLWLCVVVWVLGATTLAGTITLYYVGLGAELWALSVHLSAAVFFILSVYAVLTVIGIPERAKDKPQIRLFFSSYSTRAFVYAFMSLVFNTCYVAFGMIIAYVEHSLWLGVLVLYHLALALPRIVVLVQTRWRDSARIKDESDAQKRQLRAYAYSGLMLVLLALAIIPVIRLTINDYNSYNYRVSSIVYVSAIAAYTFTKLGISIYNFKKAHKQTDMSLIAVKNISLADALISVFMLQAMMIKELNVTEQAAAFGAKMNPAIGALISAAIFALGLYMLIGGVKRLRAYGCEQVAADATENEESEAATGIEAEKPTDAN